MAIYTRDKKGNLIHLNIPVIAGESAYEIAVSNGFVGTEQEWLESLKATGTSIDDTAIAKGNTWSSAKIEDFVHTNDGAIWSTVQGENISVSCTKEGNLREIEILGNTIQHKENLNDIQHLGELYVNNEGQPILDDEGNKQYKTEVKSNNYTSINDDFSNITVPNNFGEINRNKKEITLYSNRSAWLNSYIEITLGKDTAVGDMIDFSFETNIAVNATIGLFKNGAWSDTKHFQNATMLKYSTKVTKSGISAVRLEFSNYDKEIRVKLHSPKSHTTMLLLPYQLMKVGNAFDRLYWDSDNSTYIIEKNIDMKEINKTNLPGAIPFLEPNRVDGFTVFPMFKKDLGFNTNELNDSSAMMCDKFTHVRGGYASRIAGEWICSNANIYTILQISNDSLESLDRNGLLSWLGDNSIKIYYKLATPQLIKVNITREIEIPCYKNATYLSVMGGIDGDIKAKTPINGGQAIQVLSMENEELRVINDIQDELISTTMLAMDEMYTMLEPLLADTLSENGSSKIIDMYVAMVQIGLKTEDEIPVRYRDEVKKILVQANK